MSQAALMFSLILSSLQPVVADNVAKGVNGHTVRPMMADANVPGHKVSKPGDFTVTVGDLIELNYSYAVTPTAPKDVDVVMTLLGSVTKSRLGNRFVVMPQVVGSQTIAFYLVASKPGTETVELVIDNQKYVYNIKVQRPIPRLKAGEAAPVNDGVGAVGLAVMPWKQYTSTSDDNNVQTALNHAINQATTAANKNGADRMVEWELVKTEGIAGGFAGINHVTVTIRARW